MGRIKNRKNKSITTDCAVTTGNGCKSDTTTNKRMKFVKMPPLLWLEPLTDSEYDEFIRLCNKISSVLRDFKSDKNKPQ